MRVIGTAGHVDHGKSTLVEALTGTHPDRLKEEREREMTIDLGFAWMSLPDGEEIGIIDVPGHRDFIENMLAGVGGIDAALFVIAADEGVMPQTREHLAILDLLHIHGGVVALTKIDLVEDADWLDLVEEDVRAALAGTVLGDAPIVRVSARTHTGLSLLLEKLANCLAKSPPRLDRGKPRLPVDRIFTIAGFGTVVTGTLSDGSLQVGDELEILPAGLKSRVRGLQTHKIKETVAVPGSRTAINLTGVTVDQLRRGDVVAHPSDYTVTTRFDASFRLLKDARQPVRHNLEVKCFIGAAEVLARLRLLGVEELLPGQEGWLQLELSEPVVAARGDRFILRRPSPGETIGGGVVLDHQPKGRHKRFATEQLLALEKLSQGAPAEILLQALQILRACTLAELFARASLNEETAGVALEELAQSGQLVVIEASRLQGKEIASLTSDTLVAASSYWESLVKKSLFEVDAYHRTYPLRKGMPREELKSRLAVAPRLFNALLGRLVISGELVELGPVIMRTGHAIIFTPGQRELVDKLLLKFKNAPYSPPSIKEAQADVGDDVYAALVEMGTLLQVSGEVVFERQGYERMTDEVKNLIRKNGSITAAQARDHFNTSRRYVLALLEHLDATGVTVRSGDLRTLK